MLRLDYLPLASKASLVILAFGSKYYAVKNSKATHMTFSNNVVPIKAKLDTTIIASKRAKLASVAAQLKTEFFGLDAIIDKVISAVSAWYIFPEIITRPVIINLWGMTGVGKTQLVRRIVSLLQFQERFVEVQMDGGSISSSYNSNSITKLLGTSTIEEGMPGVLLLDEIQRFRTVDEVGGDVKVERFQDVWTLLSDGKFSADSSIFAEIEMMIAYSAWNQDGIGTDDDETESDDDEGKPKAKKKRAFKIYPYEAKNLKNLLRLPEPISEIMKWDEDRTSLALAELKSQRVTWEIDYTKLLIFISGNLDSAFTGSNSTDDCDTDADFYHEQTKKISSTDIKRNLKRRFRPEQISRLGNNHIIYPSMSKASYEALITATCKRYVDEMTAVADIAFDLDQSIYTEIYNNSVYPTQGTRPVFSSIHMIFSSVLVDATFWALEQDTNRVNMAMSADSKSVVVSSVEGRSINFPIDLELNLKKAKTTIDTKTVVAVHETGHSYVYAVLNKAAPLEIKINPASFEGGYMLPMESSTVSTKQDLLNEIAVYLAGAVAEEVIFGAINRSSGAVSDLQRATKTANDIVRNYGLGSTLARIDAPGNGGIQHVTDMATSNHEIEEILQTEFRRAKEIITAGQSLFKRVVNVLLQQNTVTQQEFIELAKGELDLAIEVPQYPFNAKWNEYLAVK